MRDRALVQIMPSTACNARCFYCYEEGHRILTMSEEIGSAAVRFISSLLQDYERISLVWFGGEPLLSMEMIEHLCAEISRNYSCDQYRLSQSVITNGALLQSALDRNFFSRCGITTIQVSMDGYGSDNARAKGFIQPECSYYQLIDSIKGCLITGYRVMVRMNMSSSNERSLVALAKDLLAAFGQFETFSVYPAPLYGKGELYLNPSRIGDAMRQFDDIIGDKHIHRQKPNWNCFDNNTYVIQPDGFVVPCEHLFGNRDCYLGNILTNVNQLTPAEMASTCMGCSNIASCKQGCYFTDRGRITQLAEHPCRSTLCWRRN